MIRWAALALFCAAPGCADAEPGGNRVSFPKDMTAQEAALHWARDRFADHLGDRPVCVRAPETVLRQMQSADSRVFAESDCAWSGPGVILSATGEDASFLIADLDCRDGTCVGQAGYVQGNLGAHSEGVELIRRPSGWLLRTTGLSIIS